MLEAKSDVIDDMSLIAEEKDKKEYADLYKAIKSSRLSKRERECIQLYFFENKKQKAIALSLQIDQRTVAKYIKRALEKISKNVKAKHVKKKETENESKNN